MPGSSPGICARATGELQTSPHYVPETQSAAQTVPSQPPSVTAERASPGPVCILPPSTEAFYLAEHKSANRASLGKAQESGSPRPTRRPPCPPPSPQTNPADPWRRHSSSSPTALRLASQAHLQVGAYSTTHAAQPRAEGTVRAALPQVYVRHLTEPFT